MEPASMLKIDGGADNVANPLQESRGMAFDQEELYMQAHWCSLNQISVMLHDVLIKRHVHVIPANTRESLSEIRDLCFKNMVGIKDEMHYNAARREANREGKKGKSKCRLMERGQ